jgi:sugar phosphate isomerase/epimerase
MTRKIVRRDFLKTTGAIGLGLGLVGNASFAFAEDKKPAGAPHAEKLGWRLGCQAYSFNRFTLFEAIDKTASVGLKYLEAYPGQKISKDIDVVINESLSEENRKLVKKKLADAGVKLVNYGVCDLPKDEAASRKIFEFAKDMGIETLTAEPSEDALEMLDKLCEEFKINIAIHNHPKPSHYWDPDVVLAAVKNRSKRIGSCSDTGHWVRSGLKPLDCLKKLEGRLISFHFKDLNEASPKAHDVPWGTGISDAKGMLEEIHRQGVKAVFSIEYEHNWDNSLPEIEKCVAYFDKVAAEILAKDNKEEKKAKKS